MARILVTGGAGFIGSHTADALVGIDHETTVLDTLDPGVHGPAQEWPRYLNPAVRRVRGDVRDAGLVRSLVAGSDVVLHLAACTGTGQSMYEMRRYFDVNVAGTATLLEAVAHRRKPLERLIVASSRAVYGEGTYWCRGCGPLTPPARSYPQLAAGSWEPPCPHCAGPTTAVATAESAPTTPGSIYGVTKLAQEQACLVAGAAYGAAVVALRYFNVFGPRQSLRNPYTGAITTFVNRVRAGRAPEVYEDGRESRDFVHVSDVVRANLLAMEHDEAVGRAVNVGTGRPVSLLELAVAVSGAMGGQAPVVSGRFRVGDVRHGSADLRLSRDVLGYLPTVAFADAVGPLVKELTRDEGADLSGVAEAELQAWGLSSEGRG